MAWAELVPRQNTRGSCHRLKLRGARSSRAGDLHQNPERLGEIWRHFEISGDTGDTWRSCAALEAFKQGKTAERGKLAVSFWAAPVCLHQKRQRKVDLEVVQLVILVDPPPPRSHKTESKLDVQWDFFGGEFAAREL